LLFDFLARTVFREPVFGADEAAAMLVFVEAFFLGFTDGLMDSRSLAKVEPSKIESTSFNSSASFTCTFRLLPKLIVIVRLVVSNHFTRMSLTALTKTAIGTDDATAKIVPE
jgi:hypothetical protein